MTNGLPTALPGRPGFFAAGLAMGMALAGCTSSTVAFPVFVKSGVTATGAAARPIAHRGLEGDEIFVSVGRSPFEADRGTLPVFCLQVSPDAPKIRSDVITPELASRWLPRWAPTPADRERGIHEHVYGSQEVFQGPGCMLGFEAGNGSLAWFLLEGTLGAEDRGPRIGPADCRRLDPLPLTRPQLLAILGQADWEGWRRDAENLLPMLLP